jgi:hypothetical protein
VIVGDRQNAARRVIGAQMTLIFLMPLAGAAIGAAYVGAEHDPIFTHKLRP